MSDRRSVRGPADRFPRPIKERERRPRLLSGPIQETPLMTSVDSTHSKASASFPDDGSTLGDWDDHEERRLVRKIDARCLVSCFLLFF